MTPPRIRGLVDKLEHAVRMHIYASSKAKPTAKAEVLKAKMDLLRAFALVSGVTSKTEQEQCAWPVGEFDNCRQIANPGKRYCNNHRQWEEASTDE